MTVNDFLDLVRRSQLVEEDQLTKFLGALAARNGRKLPDAPEKVAAEMVAANLLTEWQSEKLLAGKHKGFVLGKYKLLRHLGKGGMSQVYLAEHTLMRRKVAIKVLPANRVEDATYLERFRIEARAAAKLDDPNIVRAYDIDVHEGKTHFIVMEYVEGQDLHQLVRDKGPLPYEKAADYIAQVARGLSHAHEMGLVHRDIKPANCLLDKNEVVKLLDMGLARLIDDEASLTLDNNENVLGTADYLAPEQALNSHKADARADIYSLGCTLYFLLTGHPPFPDGSISERLIKHQVEQAPSIYKDRPDAPSVLVNICNRMMSKKVEDRYQTAGDVAERLAEWLGDRGIEVGESGKKSAIGSGSGGIGSDVFRRFAASMQKPAGESQRAGKSNGARRVAAAAATAEPEEDIGLAPLEEEAPRRPEAEVAAETVVVEPADTAPIPDIKPLKPRKSLVEEAFEAERTTNPPPRVVRRAEGEFNPLQPPGYSGPSYGTPTWVFVAVGVGIVALVGVVVAVIMTSA
jgi:serine/threonine-protein kinase